MSKIPQYDPPSRVLGAGGSFGAVNSGAGAIALGHAIQDVGDAVGVVQRARAAQEAGTGLANLRASTTQALAEAQQNATDDATGFTEGVLKTFEDHTREAVAAAKSPLGKRIITQQAQQIRGEVLDRATRFEAETRGAYRATAALKAANTTATALELDPSQWQQAGTEQMRMIDGLQLDPQTRLQLKRQADQILTEGAANGRAKQSPLATLDALSKGGDSMLDGLPPEARRRVEARARGELVDQKVGGISAAFSAKGTDAGLAALQAVQRDQSIPADLKADILAKSNAEQSQLREQRREEHADALSNIARAIATESAGTTTHDQVDTLYKVGALTPGERASMHAAVDESMLRGARNNAGAAALAEALAGGTPLDPKDGEQRKALTSLFNLTTVGQAPGSASWQAQAQSLAQRTRVLPDPATAWIRAASRSPDPSVAANAASFYGAVKTGAPDAVSELDDDTRAFAGTVNSMVEAGTPSAQAVETARANVFDVDKAVRERREHAWKGAGQSSLVDANASALSSFIDRDFHSGWFGWSNPSPMDANVARAAGAKLLSNDFDNLSEKYFLKTGDANVARSLAWDDVKRVYGPSHVNGSPSMMAFPPERFGVTPEEVRTEVGAFLKDNPQHDGTAPAEAVLVPDSLTMRLAADAMNGQAVRPSYALVGKTGDVLLDKRGVPIRYTIPTGEALTQRLRDALAAAAAEAQKQVDAARGARAKREQERQDFAEKLRSGQLPDTSD